MINQSTIETLHKMKLAAMANAFEEQLNDRETFGKFSFEERLGLMIDAEWNRRQTNKLSRHIKSAHFANPSATIEGIEYHADRKLDKGQILRFPLASTSTNSTTSYWKEHQGMGKLILPVRSGMRHAGNSSPCVIHV
jgi:hypothetical protein